MKASMKQKQSMTTISAAHSFSSVLQEGNYYVRFMHALEVIAYEKLDIIPLRQPGARAPAKRPVLKLGHHR